MSESLTPEQFAHLEFLHVRVTKTVSDIQFTDTVNPLLPTLISMARRCLSAEERLEKAVELLEHQKYCRDCAESWESCEVGKECQEFVDNP